MKSITNLGDLRFSVDKTVSVLKFVGFFGKFMGMRIKKISLMFEDFTFKCINYQVLYRISTMLLNTAVEILQLIKRGKVNFMT